MCLFLSPNFTNLEFFGGGARGDLYFGMHAIDEDEGWNVDSKGNFKRQELEGLPHKKKQTQTKNHPQLHW